MPESEIERRRVTVFIGRPNARKLEIKMKDGIFVLVTENGEEVATSKSDGALANWAFANTGIFELSYRYDLAKGDMSR
jgi:hypothetical protein